MEQKKNKKEVRLLNVDLEYRKNDNNNIVIEGYAVVFDVPATHGYTEIIDRNAFNGSDMKDVVLRYNHSSMYPILAKTKNNSLSLMVDDKGLKMRAELLDTTSGKDMYKMIQAGLLDKMSFAFTVDKDEWDYETDTRRILKFDKIFDVSIVDDPFYDTTEVFARSVENFKEEKQKYEQLKLEKEKLKLYMSI